MYTRDIFLQTEQVSTYTDLDQLANLYSVALQY